MNNKSNSFNKFTNEELLNELRNRGVVFVGGVFTKDEVIQMCDDVILGNLHDEVIDPMVRSKIISDVLTRVESESKDTITELFEEFYFDEELRETRYKFF